MCANVEIDDELIARCVKLTGLRTKKEIINLALEELIASRKRHELLEYEGKLPWEGNLRKMRKSRV